MPATGCQQGYRWDLGDVVKAEQRARDEGKILFVFYQLWTDPTSNRMKGRELLSDPEVEAEFRTPSTSWLTAISDRCTWAPCANIR